MMKLPRRQFLHLAGGRGLARGGDLGHTLGGAAGHPDRGRIRARVSYLLANPRQFDILRAAKRSSGWKFPCEGASS
jgi:hypothetical protein